MGVSGAGKSTIGNLLSQELTIPFFDGDDFHPPENIEKMTREIPLTDDDRMPWLLKLNELARQYQEKTGCVIACSGLKKSYREILAGGIENFRWIYLKGSFDQIAQRLNLREGHFMSSRMLQSQFDILEETEDVVSINIDLDPDQIIKTIIDTC